MESYMEKITLEDVEPPEPTMKEENLTLRIKCLKPGYTCLDIRKMCQKLAKEIEIRQKGVFFFVTFHNYEDITRAQVQLSKINFLSVVRIADTPTSELEPKIQLERQPEIKVFRLPWAAFPTFRTDNYSDVLDQAHKHVVAYSPFKNSLVPFDCHIFDHYPMKDETESGFWNGRNQISGHYELSKAKKDLKAQSTGQRINGKYYYNCSSGPKLLLNTIIGECAKCGEITGMYCKECKITLYCSSSCADSDWKRHSRMCQRQSELPMRIGTVKESIERLQAKANDESLKLIESGKLQLQNKTTVKIISFANLNDIAVLQVDAAITEAYNSLLTAVEASGERLKPLLNSLSVGDVVLTTNSFGRCDRAIIQKIKDSNVIYVVCIDYGNVEVKTSHMLYEIPYILEKIPSYLHRVSLQIPDRLKYNLNGIVNLRNFVENNVEFTMILNESLETNQNQDFGRINCRLLFSDFDENNGGSMDLKELVMEDTGEVYNVMEEIPVRELPHRDWCTDFKEKKILITENNFAKHLGLLFGIPIKYIRELYDIETDLNTRIEPDCQQFNPKVGDVCLARVIDGDNIPRWYRGFCLMNFDQIDPVIWFYDYGSINTVSQHNLIPMPCKLFSRKSLIEPFEISDVPLDTMSDEEIKLKYPVNSIIEYKELREINKPFALLKQTLFCKFELVIN